MMQLFLWFLFIASGTACVYGNYAYARANYPRSAIWRAALFFAGVIAGLAVASAIQMPTFENERQTGFLLLVGLFFGIGAAFLFPLNMQNIIPKRKIQEQNDDDRG